MTIPTSAWIVEPPVPLFAVSVETYRAHGVERTAHVIHSTQTGETIAETPHAWAASLIAQALNATPRPHADTARHRAARESLRARLTAPAATLKAREVSR